MNLTPIYQILAGGVDVTGNLSPRMKRLTVRDADGVNSDEVTIELDDSDFSITPPPTGTLLL
jgi:phage protein D